MTNSGLKRLDLALARCFKSAGFCEDANYIPRNGEAAELVSVYFDRERVRLEGSARVVRRENIEVTIVIHDMKTLPQKAGILELLDGSRYMLEQKISSDEGAQTWGVKNAC